MQGQGEILAAANGRGDTKKIYEVTNVLKGKSEKPPVNLSTDGQGNALCNAEDVADRWCNFLRMKFQATEQEALRQGIPIVALPNTQGVDDLSEAKIRKEDISKLKVNKACGPDEIPIEVFQNCPVCADVLTKLIQKIWSSEEVPEEFVQATFVKYCFAWLVA